jgi:hypothetical protein
MIDTSFPRIPTMISQVMPILTAVKFAFRTLRGLHHRQLDRMPAAEKSTSYA